MLMPSADQLANRRDAFARAGDFDHEVGAADRLPEADGFVNRLLRLEREIRGNFEADVAIAALRAVVNATQSVGGVLNIANGEMLVDSLSVQILALREFFERLRIVGASGDGFFEDRGIRGHAAKAVFLNQAREFARGQQVAADIVEPDGLAEVG